MTIYSFDVLLSLLGIRLLCHVEFSLLFLDLHTDFSGGGSGGLVFYLLNNFPQFVVIHTVKGFSVVNEAEIDVFLEFSCFFYDPTNIDDLISGSSAFSKSSLNIWKFSIYTVLKPSLGEFWALLFSHVKWVQLCGSLSILWHCLSLGLEWNWPFPVL